MSNSATSTETALPATIHLKLEDEVPAVEVNGQIAPTLEVNDQVAPALEVNDQVAPALEVNDQIAPAVEVNDQSYLKDVHVLADKDGKIKMRAPPVFATKLEERKHQMLHLAVAYRVFAREGFAEGSAGHISLRDPVNPENFWINPLAKHFSRIRPSDLVLVNLKGEVLPGGSQEPINIAAFQIHSAIHIARPDINAACHAHSIYGRAFSCFGRPLEMLFQDALRFYNDLSVYDTYGGTVISPEEGVHIAEALGPKNRSMILQNHGMITCGKTVDEAAFLFISLDRCCHSQLLANAAAVSGWEKKPIKKEEAEMTHKASGNSNKMWLHFQTYFDLEIGLDPSLLEEA